jgi:hypothetical protein
MCLQVGVGCRQLCAILVGVDGRQFCAFCGRGCWYAVMCLSGGGLVVDSYEPFL